MKSYVRRAVIDDVEAIYHIYRPYVEKSTFTFETIMPSLNDFQNRFQTIMLDYPVLVYVIDDKVVGYVYAQRQKFRQAYDWNVELSIYTNAGYTGRHYGRILYHCMFAILNKQNVVNAYAQVVSDNVASVILHNKMGFRELGVYRNTGFKNGRWLDLIAFEKRIGNYHQSPQPFISISKLSNACVLDIIARASNQYID